jgi:hypothetical protein
MASHAQRKATAEHRKRAAGKGLVRVEVQVLAEDAGLVRDFARALRSGDAERARVTEAITSKPKRSLADVFDEISKDVSGHEFDDAFDIPRDQSGWRPIDL